jgi:hypothetical protein
MMNCMVVRITGKVSRLVLFSFYFIMSILGFSISANAQISYPTVKVLKDSGVSIIRVYRRQMEYIGGPEEARMKLGVPNTTRALYQVYYLNNFGYPDSVLTNNKYIYFYDGEDLVEYKNITHEGRVRFQSKTTKTDSGVFSRAWGNGKLKSTTFVNKDSILVERLGYYGNDTAWRSAMWFDPERNLKTEHWRGENGSYKIETYQWFTEDGKPSSFHHTLEEREPGKSKIIRKEKTYSLDSAGNVVNKYLGRFDDPYLRYNYFKRYDKYTKARFYGQGQFREDYLVRSKENNELYTFSGVQLVVSYELEYEFRE